MVKSAQNRLMKIRPLNQSFSTFRKALIINLNLLNCPIDFNFDINILEIVSKMQCRKLSNFIILIILQFLQEVLELQ